MQFVRVSIVACFCLAFSCFTGGSDASPSPILIIPGFMESRLNVQDASDNECNTNGDAVRIWYNETYITALPNCFLNQMTMNYSNGRYFESQDATVSTAKFSSVSSLVQETDFDANSTNPNILDYFYDRGYIADVNIRAAPYDWRLGAEQLREKGYYASLRTLIELMYEDNDNTKVTLVVISMGGPVSLYFLTQVVNQEWKDTYIHSYISLAASWSGAAGVDFLLTPPPSNYFVFDFVSVEASPEEIFLVTRSHASLFWLIPTASVFDDAVLVSTPTRNYTVSDYEQLFMDAGYPEGYTRFTETEIDISSPNVPTYCFYGLGDLTPLTAVYNAGFPDTQPTYLYGEGDGVVNKPSLEVCLQWANSGYPFNRTVFQGLNHATISTDKTVFQAIGRVVGAPVDPINGVSPLATIKPVLYLLVLIGIISIAYTLFSNLVN